MNKNGFSLIELLIAILISLLILGFVFVVIRDHRRVWSNSQSQSEANANLILAERLIGDHIRLAGYQIQPEVVLASLTPPIYSGMDANNLPYLTVRFQGANDDSLQSCLGRAVPIDKISINRFYLRLNKQNNKNQNIYDLYCAEALINVMDVVASNIEPQSLTGGNTQPIIGGILNLAFQFTEHTDDQNTLLWKTHQLVQNWQHIEHIKLIWHTQGDSHHVQNYAELKSENIITVRNLFE